MLQDITATRPANIFAGDRRFTRYQARQYARAILQFSYVQFSVSGKYAACHRPVEIILSVEVVVEKYAAAYAISALF